MHPFSVLTLLFCYVWFYFDFIIILPGPLLAAFTANVHGSLKKRVAPLPPPTGSIYGTLPSSHSRTPSDPMATGYHTLNYTHKRSPSSDSSSGRSVIQTGESHLRQSPPPPLSSPHIPFKTSSFCFYFAPACLGSRTPFLVNTLLVGWQFQFVFSLLVSLS